MKKTSIYLRDREVRRLRDLSRLTGRPQSDLVREAIAAYEPGPADRDLAIFVDDERGPGDSVADHAEEELLDGFGR